MLVEYVYHSCKVSVSSRESMVDLMVLEMVDFDVILSMDWLASCHATLDYHGKTLKFDIRRESSFLFQGGDRSETPYNLI